MASLRALAKLHGVSHEKIRKLLASGAKERDLPALLGNDPAPVEVKQPKEPVTAQNEGLEAAISRLKQAEVAAHSDYLACTQEGPVKAAKLKNWTAILEQLRKVSAENPQITQATGESLSREDVTRTLSFLFTSLKIDLEALPEKVASEAVGKSRDDIRQLMEGHIKKIMGGLHECKYLK